MHDGILSVCFGLIYIATCKQQDKVTERHFQYSRNFIIHLSDLQSLEP